jgi:hypothetical protein
MFENTETRIICRYDRLVDIEPESQSQWLDSEFDIESGVEVGITGVTAIVAFEETLVSRPDFTASSAGFASIGRSDIHDRTTGSQRLVFDKVLKLAESPRMESPVEPPALVGTDSFQIFHRNDVAFLQSIHYLSAYPMVLALHKTCPSARKAFEMPLGGFRSFALECGNELLMANHLRHDASVEPTIGCHGKVLYSDIDAKNPLVLSRAHVDRDVFGKAHAEKNAVTSVNPDEAFIDFPIGIFRGVGRKWNIELLSACDCAETQYSTLVGEASWRIDSHRTVGYGWFALGSFDHSTRLFDAGYGQLGGQSSFSQVAIDERMESDVVSDSSIPSDIDAMLESSLIDIHSFEGFFAIWESEVHSSPAQHRSFIGEKRINIFPPIPPTIETVGILGGI